MVALHTPVFVCGQCGGPNLVTIRRHCQYCRKYVVRGYSCDCGYLVYIPSDLLTGHGHGVCDREVKRDGSRAVEPGNSGVPR